MEVRRLLLALAVLLHCGTALAQEQAFTNRATELKERGATDARTLASLTEGAAVKVLERGGGWTRVESGGQQGWVRVFHLRFPVTAQTAPSSSSALSTVTSAFGFGRDTAKTATVATTGIRGLSPDDLKNATPNPAAVAKLQTYRADQPSAERFARDGKLAAVSVPDPDGGRR